MDLSHNTIKADFIFKFKNTKNNVNLIYILVISKRFRFIVAFLAFLTIYIPSVYILYKNNRMTNCV